MPSGIPFNTPFTDVEYIFCYLYKYFPEMDINIIDRIRHYFYDFEKMDSNLYHELYFDKLENIKLELISEYQNNKSLSMLCLLECLIQNYIGSYKNIINEFDLEYRDIEILIIFLTYVNNFRDAKYFIELYDIDKHMYDNILITLCIYQNDEYFDYYKMPYLKKIIKFIEYCDRDVNFDNCILVRNIVLGYIFDYNVYEYLFNHGFEINLLDTLSKILLFTNGDDEIKALLVNHDMTISDKDLTIDKFNHIEGLQLEPIDDILSVDIEPLEMLTLYMESLKN